MRNLKKVLSLALAMMMLVGMMSISAGAVSFADFTDKDKVDHADAVAMLTELNIVKGTDTGAFNPDGVVTRAAMAKMICVTLNKGNDNGAAFVGAKASFKDTDGHWAEGYVEYCAALGIIAGDGTGNFNPDASVTGSQAAKMILVALGYKPATEGLVGAGWQLKTTVLASSLGIYDEIATNPTTTYDRDDAAQMIFNSLMGTCTVGYNRDGQLVENTKTLAEYKFGLVKLTGVVTTNEFGSLGTTPGTTTAAGNTEITKSDATKVTIKASTTADMLGKTVVAYTKSGDTTKIYGTPVVATTNKVVTTSSALGATDITKLLSDNNLTISNATPVVVNFGQSATTVTDTTAFTNVRGVQLTFIDKDGNGTVDTIMKLAKSVGEVTSYNAKDNGSMTIATKGVFGVTASGLTAKQTTGFAAVAKGDYVLYYNVGTHYYVEKCNKVEATVSSIVGAKIVANGTTYAQSGLVATVDGTNLLAAAVGLGKSAALFLDNAGNVVMTDAVAATTNYLMVLESNSAATISSFNPLQAKLLLSDGTTVVGKISKIGTAAVDDGNKALSAVIIYSYTLDANGAYKLTAATTNTAITGITKNKVDLGGSVYANSNTTFVVQTGTSPNFSYSAYTGIANVPTLTVGTTYAVVSSNLAKTVFALGASSAASSSNNIFVASKTPTQTLDASGAIIYTYSVVYKGEVTTLLGTDAMFSNVGLHESSAIANGKITLAGTYSAPQMATIASNGVLATTAKAYTYNDNTKVFVLNAATGAVTDSSIGEIDTNGEYADMISVIKDSSITSADVALYVLITRNYTATFAGAPTVALAVGTSTPAVITTNVAVPVPGATDATGVVNFTDATGTTIKVNVGDTAPATSTITINGGTYISGADYTITGIGTLKIVVTTTQTGCTTCVRTFNVTVN